MNALHLAAGLLTITPAAFAQTNLPAGNYIIEGTVTAISSSICPLAAKRPVSGHMYYPGIGHDTTQLVLESIVPGKSVTVAFMNAFPQVPPGGLNGWSGANHPAPNYTQFLNGTLVSGGTSAYLYFNLTYVIAGTVDVAQGTLTLSTDSIGPCEETIQGVFSRVAPFREVPG